MTADREVLQREPGVDFHVIWLPGGELIVLTSEELDRAFRRGNCYRQREPNGVSAERLVTAKELADLLSVPQTWVEEAARQKKIPSVLAGKYRRFNPSSVVSALKRSDANEQ